jgi:hypothetical protein
LTDFSVIGNSGLLSSVSADETDIAKPRLAVLLLLLICILDKEKEKERKE